MTHMRFVNLYVPLIMLIVATETAAQTTTCSCRGKLIDQFAGGDGEPLKWQFKAYLVKAGTASEQPIICYLKNVENVGNDDVWNVDWTVADYARQKIPAKKPSTSCPEIPGQISDLPLDGRLRFGVGGQFYETKVRPRAASKEASKEKWPELTSDIGFFTADAEGKDSYASWNISSYVQQEGDSTSLKFTVKNPSDAIAAFYINMPTLSGMAKDLPFTKEPQIVKPNDTVTFSTRINGGLKTQPAVVVFLDQSLKNVVSIEKIGLYAPIDGKIEVSDDEIWKDVLSKWQKQ